VEEVVGGVVQRTYTYGLQRISQSQLISGAWTASFYGYDGFGSVRMLTDAGGAPTDAYDYDAWGNAVNATGSTPNVYLYRGEQYDPDLRLYYLRARYYYPLSGRFLSTDPEKPHARAPETLQRYWYADGDPIYWIDPTGLCASGAVTPEAGGYVHLPAFPIDQISPSIPKPRGGGCGASGPGFPGGSSAVWEATHEYRQGKPDRCNPCREQDDIQKRVDRVLGIINNVRKTGGTGGGTPIMDTTCRTENFGNGRWAAVATTTSYWDPNTTKHPCVWDCAAMHESVHADQCVNRLEKLELPAYQMELVCLLTMLWQRSPFSPF
jgi:RHS repeat-associated protein